MSCCLIWFSLTITIKISSPSSLFRGSFMRCPYTLLSESTCFLKTLLNYCSFEVQKNLQNFCNKFPLFIVMDSKREKERRKEGILLLPSTLCPSFLLLNSLFWFLHALANFQACRMRSLKMKLSFRSHMVVIHTQHFNLNHYCIPSFSFYNNPLNAFKYEKEWQPVDPNGTQMTYKIHTASLPDLLALPSLMDGIVILASKQPHTSIIHSPMSWITFWRQPVFWLLDTSFFLNLWTKPSVPVCLYVCVCVKDDVLVLNILIDNCKIPWGNI